MEQFIIPALLFLLPSGVSIFLWFKMNSMQRQIDTLTQGMTEENLIAIVNKYVKALNSCDQGITDMHEEFNKIREETATFYRKTGLVRYQAFKDTGGDQSFSLALLNQNNDGFIITSLFGRDHSKMFAKKIETGSSSHTLTEEEQKALTEALSS